MNDLNYIFYKPKLMLTDCLDICDPETELAHRRLCDYVWAMDRPPKADDRFLRQFTRATDSSWGRIKRGLMDKGWFESGGLLLHRGAIAALNEAALKFAENHNRTAAAGGRPLMVGTTDSLTGIVTYSVTTPATVPVTPAVTQPVTSGQRKGEDRKGKEGGEERAQEIRFPEAPSWNLVLAKAQTIGLAEWRARDWFDEMEGCGWRDHQNRQICRWESVLMRVKLKWESDGRPAGPPASGMSKTTSDRSGERTGMRENIDVKTFKA